MRQDNGGWFVRAAIGLLGIASRIFGDADWGKAIVSELPNVPAGQRARWILGGLRFLLRRRPTALIVAVATALSAALFNAVSATAILTRSRAALEADIAGNMRAILPVPAGSGRTPNRSEMVEAAADLTSAALAFDARFAIAAAAVTILASLFVFCRWTAIPLLVSTMALLANALSATMQVAELEVTPVVSGICGQLAMAASMASISLLSLPPLVRWCRTPVSKALMRERLNGP